MAGGSGAWDEVPWTRGSALSARIRARSFGLRAVWERTWVWIDAESLAGLFLHGPRKPATRDPRRRGRGEAGLNPRSFSVAMRWLVSA